MNRYYYCIKTDEYITREQLAKEFSELKKADPKQYDYDFSHYLMNCLTINNGSLETMQQRKNYIAKQIFLYSLDGFDTDTDFSEEIESLKQELQKLEKYMQQ